MTKFYFNTILIFLLAFGFNLKAQKSSSEKIQTQVVEFIKKIDWGGLDKYKEDNKKELSNKTVDVVFMGDSITEGWSNYFPDFFTNNNYVNRGISGQTTSQMLLRYRQDVIDLKPKAVIILAGINDIAHNTKYYSIDVIAGNIFSMVELAKANGILPIISSVLPSDKFAWNPEILPAESIISLNRLLKSYAQKNDVSYLDYYGTMNNKKGGLKSDLTNDGVHITIKGYSVMNEMAKNHIQNSLK